MQAHYHQQQFPQQQQLKCPRCESTNTKFCYYNNYNLSQPRHFCKDCRRYWTRGGTLRKVPVGGGTRKATAKRSATSSRASSPPPATIVSRTRKEAKNESSVPATSRPVLVPGDGNFSSPLLAGSCYGVSDGGDNFGNRNNGNGVADELNGMTMNESLAELQASSGCWTSSSDCDGGWPHHLAIFTNSPGSNFQ